MSEAENPFARLKAQINADPEYAWAWFCNLSVPFTDVGVDHRLADSGAALVMAQMFGFDITADERFQGSKSGAQAYFEARVSAEREEDAELNAAQSSPTLPEQLPEDGITIGEEG